MRREKPSTWWEVVQRNREDDEQRIKKGLFPRFSQERFADTGNIKSTPEADKFIEAHRIKRDENGVILPSTPRGKRRRQKRQGG